MPSVHLDTVLRYLRRLRRLSHAGVLADLTDAQLLTSFVESRKEAAFSHLLERHGPMVLSVCRRVLRGRDGTEDAFQATFVVLARRARSIRRRDSLASWLYGVALRVAQGFRAKASARFRHERLAATMAKREPEKEPTWEEFRDVIDEEIAVLPEKYQAPLVLHYLEGKTQLETAQALRCSRSTVRDRLEQGRELLRERLARRGITTSTGALAAALVEQAAPAAVPPSLTLAAVHAVMGGTLSAPATAIVQEVMYALGLAKTKALASIVVILGILAGGTISAAQLLSEDRRGVKTEHTAQTPLMPDRNPERVDQCGDPLPEGAVARLGPQRFRYEGYLRRLIYTPDGKTLLGYSNSGVHLWDAATGTEQQRFAVRVTGFQVEMDLSRDGSTLAVCNGAEDEETKISLWDLRSGKNTANLSLPDGEGRTAIMNHVRFAPDGKTLAVTWTPQEDARKGKVVVFDVAAGKVRAFLGHGESRGYNFAFAPDGKTLALAVGAPEPGVQLWDTGTWRFIRMLTKVPEAEARRHGAVTMTFSPDGKTLALASSRVALIDVATGQVSQELKLPPPGFASPIEGLAFCSYSKTLVGADMWGRVVAWEGTKTKVLRARQSGADHVALALSPDGKTVAVGGSHRTLRLWDVGTGRELFADYQGHDPGTRCIAVAPDGKTLVTVGNGQIDLWDTASWQRRGTLPGKACTLSFSEDGKELAGVASNGTTMTGKVAVWDFASGNETATVTVPDRGTVRKANLAPNGKMLFTLETADKENCFYLRNWEVPTRMQTRSWKIPLKSLQESALLPVRLAQDGKTVFVASGEAPAGVHVFDAITGRKRFVPVQGEGTAHFVPSPDARVVASWIFNQYWIGKPSSPVCLSEVLTGTEILVLKGNSESVATAAWSADGRLLATGDQRPDSRMASSEQTIRLWNATTGKELARFTGFKSDVNALTFAPDAGRLIAALHDGTILVWDTAYAARSVLKVQHLNEDDLRFCLNALAEKQAANAYGAMWKLIAAPHDSVPFLRSQLKPAVAADLAKIERWIADLGSEQFTVRQRATKELKNAGEQVKAPIAKAMQSNPSLEACRRLESILDAIASAVPGPATLQAVRAITVLEKIGSTEARQVLETLSKGAPGARETLEAQQALAKLNSSP